MLTFASKHDFLVKKQGSATSPFLVGQWFQKLNLYRSKRSHLGPHQNDNKTIVVEFRYTRNTSLSLHCGMTYFLCMNLLRYIFTP